jgi:signal peptidase II
MKLKPGWRLALLALAVFALDQATKLAVQKYLPYGYSGDKEGLIPGFFRLVHWGNTGAAWSFFSGQNTLLTIISLVAMLVLFLSRRHFDLHTLGGQIALGLIFGGIVGNLTDRMRIGHVVDFLYFYVIRRNGDEAGFPAFNVADSAICIGVGLLFIFSWQNDSAEATAPSSSDAKTTSENSQV